MSAGTDENIDHLLSDDPDTEEISRYLDEQERRHYEKDPDLDVYSVTTILDQKNNGEEPYGVQKWKENNDGKGDNADWEHILEYKQNRGTMAHYAALSQLEEMHPHSDQLWSDDEKQSLNQIMDRVGEDEFMYSIMKDRGYVPNQEAFQKYREMEDSELDDILYQDLEFFKNQFAEIMLDKGVTPEDVISVEHMFALPENPESGHKGYGGQADMIFEDPATGEHVVVDLKTSKNVYDKHKYQAAAYAQAALESPDMNGDYIDRAEIWRINPDQEEVEIVQLDDHKEYWEDFAELTAEAYK